MSQSSRLAAILAADVAGYSRLIGADESPFQVDHIKGSGGPRFPPRAW
jgi:hypothetical protein